ncbi:MAG: esterase-like activity of phytase family protein [Sphingomonas sp.]|nr:esterase-like activity of phytase family protein [Sphingomonas sp.]
MNTERKVQPKFSIGRTAAALGLLAAIGLFDLWLGKFPNRQELGSRIAAVAQTPVVFEPEAFAPFRLAGAWRLTSSDPRFGGISALAVEDGRLIALSDSGVVVRFGESRASAVIGELPAGPGSKRFKRNRDSEALVADPQGRGWWVAFENRDELWLYDPTFATALQRIRLGDRGWGKNYGFEGAATDGRSLLLLHEAGDNLLRVSGRQGRVMRIAGARARLSDAVDLGDGRWLAVERQLTPLGFRNALVILERIGGDYRLGRRFALPVGRRDNVEAIALERRAGGTRRLWLMTDDNFNPALRTLLIALDIGESGVGERLVEN